MGNERRQRDQDLGRPRRRRVLRRLYARRPARHGRPRQHGQDLDRRRRRDQDVSRLSRSRLCDAAFTHDGKRVVGGDWLGNVKVWDAAEAKEVFATARQSADAGDASSNAGKGRRRREANGCGGCRGANWLPQCKVVADEDAALKAATDKHAAAAAAAAEGRGRSRGRRESDRKTAVAAVKTATDAADRGRRPPQRPQPTKRPPPTRSLAEKTAAAKAAADKAAADRAAADKLTAEKSADAPTAEKAAVASRPRRPPARSRAWRSSPCCRTEGRSGNEGRRMPRVAATRLVENAQAAADCCRKASRSADRRRQGRSRCACPSPRPNVDEVTKAKTDADAAGGGQEAGGRCRRRCSSLQAQAALTQAEADKVAFEQMTVKLAAADRRSRQAGRCTNGSCDCRPRRKRKRWLDAAAAKAAVSKDLADKLAALQAELTKAQADQKAADEAAAAKAKAAADAAAALPKQLKPPRKLLPRSRRRLPKRTEVKYREPVRLPARSGIVAPGLRRKRASLIEDALGVLDGCVGRLESLHAYVDSRGRIAPIEAVVVEAIFVVPQRQAVLQAIAEDLDLLRRAGWRIGRFEVGCFASGNQSSSWPYFKMASNTFLQRSMVSPIGVVILGLASRRWKGRRARQKVS